MTTTPAARAADVIIIGGGISGLATGALLAHAGRRVIVLEKGNTAGGRAYTYEDRGFTLNYGPHGMYTPESGVLAEVMARLGRPVPACGYPLATRSFWQHRERFASMGAKPHQLMTTNLFSVGGRVAMAKIMLAMRNEDRERIADDMTLGAWIASKTSDPQAVEFMHAFATVNSYTNPAGDLSAKWFLGHMQRSLFAKDFVGYMHGGWRSMYGAWRDEIEAGGGLIVTGARVDELEVRDGHITAACTAAGRYEGAAFVSTLPPQDAPALAPAGTPLRAELAGWSTLQDVRAYTIDLGLGRALREDLSFVYDVQRHLYFSIHSESAPDLAPAGCQLLHAMAYLTPEEAADEGRRNQRRDELEAGLDRHFAGWREATVVERRLTDARVTGARRTPANIARLVPMRAAAAGNLYFVNDARDVDGNLAQVCLAAAMQVETAITAAARAGLAAATT